MYSIQFNVVLLVRGCEPWMQRRKKHPFTVILLLTSVENMTWNPDRHASLRM